MIMAIMFQEESNYQDNRTRKNFVFIGFPFATPISLDDYRSVLTEIENEYPIRLWHFLNELTTDELMRKLWRAILRSDLCIFDISGGNPNVSFEIGLAVARFKKCSTILKTGVENPLGRSDLSYSERSEYSSRITLKETLLRIIKSKSIALTEIRQAAVYLHNSAGPYTVDQIEVKLITLVNEVFKYNKITKTRAESLIQDRAFADVAMQHLREKGIFEVDGARRGAKWIFGPDWITNNHEVVGIT
jgi:hypothetical protein